MLANANIGGEACYRGAMLGALLGAHAGLEAIRPHDLVSGLPAPVHTDVEVGELVTLTHNEACLRCVDASTEAWYMLSSFGHGMPPSLLPLSIFLACPTLTGVYECAL
jgi:hypothetical protein